jgi:Methyltransferase domain
LINGYKENMYSRDKIISLMHEIKNESDQIGPYVVIAQPRRDKREVAAQNFDGHIGLHVDLHGFSHGFVDIDGQLVDVARNYLIEEAIASGAKYLFFIGEDTVVPYDAFKILHRTAEQNPGSVVVGVYYIKLSDAMIMVRTGDWITVPNVDPGQILEAWQTGMDCMLIPIDLLKEMKEEEPELPFCCIGNNVDGIPFIGEDNFFVHRLHKRGTKLLVNTDVQCLHMDLASGKYTAHPDVDLRKYYTNIPITERLKLEDKEFIDKRWLNRLPKSTHMSLSKMMEEWAQEGKPIKFNMGCGGDSYPDYIGIDQYGDAADIKEDIMTLNLPQNCADEIFASHMIEHVYFEEAVELLKKWFYSLKPDGKLVMELPDLKALCERFSNCTEQERLETTLCIYGTMSRKLSPAGVRGESPHLWGYAPESMKNLLRDIGYRDIEIKPQQGTHIGKNFRVEAVK